MFIGLWVVFSRPYIEVYDSIKKAYNSLRQAAAQSNFQKDYKLLASAQQKIINKEVPMVISEADPVSFFE